MKEISDDIYVSPPPHFSTGRNFPGGNFEKQPRRERENFFYSEVEKEVEERGKEGEGERKEGGGGIRRQGKFKKEDGIFERV